MVFFIVLTGVVYFLNGTRFSLAADVVSVVKSEGIVARIVPEQTLFTISNMAPGNRETAQLTIFNEGTLDFSYMMNAELSGGSQALYNILDLQIYRSDGKQLYAGKMQGLKSMELGTLSASGSETLDFFIGFPIECGNEYQNLNLLIKFVINVTERPLQLQVVWEPPLEKSDVNVRRGRIMPIRFHLEDNGVYDTVKRDLTLVISGVDEFNNPVEYVFMVSQGTLLWQSTSSKPQYELPLLDTGKYPMKAGSYYSGTVKYGNFTLGTTQFKSGK